MANRVQATPVSDRFQNHKVHYKKFESALLRYYSVNSRAPKVQEIIQSVLEKEHSFTRAMQNANIKIPSVKQRAVELKLQERLPQERQPQSRCNELCVLQIAFRVCCFAAITTSLAAMLIKKHCQGFPPQGAG